MSDQPISKPSRHARTLMILITLAIHAGLAYYLYQQVAQPTAPKTENAVQP